MQKEKALNVETVGQQLVMDNILEQMRAVVTDDQGNIVPGFEGAFDNFIADEFGNPVLQTMSGMVMINPEQFTETQTINYSPNLGVDAEPLAAEINDIAQMLYSVGAKMQVCTAHYVDANGKVSYGDEARKIRQHVETTALLENIKRLQEKVEAETPRLILPNKDIITR